MNILRKIAPLFLLFVFFANADAAPKKTQCNADPDIKALLKAMGQDEELERLILSNEKAVKKFEDLTDAGLEDLASKADTLRKFLAIPNLSKHNNNFGEWYDDLTAQELDILWEDEKVRETLSAKFRNPGKLHEWCMVCKAPILKRAGIKFDEIKKWRTEIADLEWTIPDKDVLGNPILDPNGVPYVGAGETGGHGGNGSTKFHNELAGLIDNLKGPESQYSAQIAQFKDDVKDLGEKWGIDNWDTLYKQIWE